MTCILVHTSNYRNLCNGIFGIGTSLKRTELKMPHFPQLTKYSLTYIYIYAVSIRQRFHSTFLAFFLSLKETQWVFFNVKSVHGFKISMKKVTNRFSESSEFRILQFVYFCYWHRYVLVYKLYTQYLLRYWLPAQSIVVSQVKNSSSKGVENSSQLVAVKSNIGTRAFFTKSHSYFSK